MVLIGCAEEIQLAAEIDTPLAAGEFQDAILQQQVDELVNR